MNKIISRAISYFAIFSALIIAFSTFLFVAMIPQQQSRYRLARYEGVKIETLEKYKSETLPVVPQFANVATDDAGWHQNFLEAPGFIEFDVPAGKDVNGKYVTKINFKVVGGRMFDNRVIHWKGKKVSDYNDNNYFGYPIAGYANSQTIVIDDDVAKVRIMPFVTRGSKFKLVNLEVTKILISNN